MTVTIDRPRLRPGLAAARDADDPLAIVLYDQFRLSRRIVRLTAREFTWLQWLDGVHSLRDMQAKAMRQTGGGLAPIDPLLALIQRLDEALFLDTPKFAELLTAPVREPACIGCYSADPDELRVQLDGYFTADGGPGLPAIAPAPPKGKAKATNRQGSLRALLAPHIDYARGGISYAWGYKELAERCSADLFVIIATSHYSPSRFTLTRQDFDTPLGRVQTDQDYLDRIVSHYGDGLFDDPIAHIPEHSIELEVVFLQHLFGRRRPIRIVPLLVGSFQDCVEQRSNPADCTDIARMVEALRRAEHESATSVCYIISGDLAHIGPKFGDRGTLKKHALTSSRTADATILKHLEDADHHAYLRHITAEDDTRRICGMPPTWLALEVIRPKYGRTLHYDQYVHPRGLESVSFASVGFYE